MKKITYLLLTVIGMVFYCSCSTTDVTEEMEPSVQYAVDNSEVQGLIDFQNKLEALNEQTFTGQPPTRGLKNFWKKFIAIVVCDALGGGMGFVGGPVGAATGAITASAAAAITPVDKFDMFTRTEDVPTSSMIGMNTPEIALSSNLIPVTPSSPAGPTIEDSIGYYHNVVLLALKNDIPAGPVALDTIIVKVAELTYGSYNTPKKAVIDNLKANRSFYEQLTTKVMPHINQDASLTDLIRRFQRQYPSQAEKLRTLEIFINGLWNIEFTDNNGGYLNEALALLASTPMDPTTKRDVRNALIVANASYQLWKSYED